MELPIPEAKKIILEITLYRLPYRLKPLFKNSILKRESSYKTNEISDKDIKKKSKKRKAEETTLNSDKSKLKLENSDFVNNGALTPNISKIGEQETRKSLKNDKDNLISNTLNFNIPLKLKIEINRKEKCSKIFEYLKGFSELNLEQDENFSEFVILSGDTYIEQEMIIDDAFLNNEKIFIYELLNNRGIKYIF